MKNHSCVKEGWKYGPHFPAVRQKTNTLDTFFWCRVTASAASLGTFCKLWFSKFGIEMKEKII